ncbi:MAG: efflux RND transporter periplasmic adaptor subunit [Candidatus Acidiferrales bacterium]
MKSLVLIVSFGLAMLGAGCSSNSKQDTAAEAPPSVSAVQEQDSSVVTVEHPERFPLIAAVQHSATSSLQVTGTVAPDVSRTVPVISLASGRVVEIKARLGDTVQKGQLLMRVQSVDVAGAYSDYRKAVTDEVLTRTQFERAKELYQHGAIALNDLEVAQDAEDKAKVDVETTAEHLRALGSPLDRPSAIVDIVAPVSGVITDQQVTNAAGVQSLSSTNPFTISDLSHVWILCDVYENQLPNVRLGETADVTPNAYPNQVIEGRISNIGSVLDPTLRTAKVRIEVRNPGTLRPGMFVTANFHGLKKEMHAAVPASAIVHLHDRDWVYAPAEAGKFRRVEVKGGNMLQNRMQELLSGLQPGQKVVANALELQNTLEQ